MAAAKRCIAPTAIAKPSDEASAAMIVVSATNRRSSRLVLAPSDARTATSLTRWRPRAYTRFARFAHAAIKMSVASDTDIQALRVADSCGKTTGVGATPSVTGTGGAPGLGDATVGFGSAARISAVS